MVLAPHWPEGFTVAEANTEGPGSEVVDLTGVREPWGTGMVGARVVVLSNPAEGGPVFRRQVNANVVEQGGNTRQAPMRYRFRWGDMVKSEADALWALLEEGHFGGLRYTINTPPASASDVPNTMTATLVAGSATFQRSGAQSYQINATFEEKA